MATLAPAGLVKSSSASGSFDALQRASTPGRQVPTSPKSSSGRLDQDAFLSEKSGAEDGARGMAASSDGARSPIGPPVGRRVGRSVGRRVGRFSPGVREWRRARGSDES